MKNLGYPFTWRTFCFLNGCGSEVFGHTNGNGDFVMFDELGPPWPVHECYLNRICALTEDAEDPSRSAVIDEKLARLRARGAAGDIPTVDLDPAATNRYEKELDEVRARRPDIAEVMPGDYLAAGVIPVVGYVQDIIENAVAIQMEKLRQSLGRAGDLIERQLQKLGSCRTQLTVVDSELRSFTVFANTSQLPIGRKDVVVLRLRAQGPLLPQQSGKYDAIRLLKPFFICVDIQRMPSLTRKIVFGTGRDKR